MRFSAALKSVQLLTNHSPAALLTFEVPAVVFVVQAGHWKINYVESADGESSTPGGVTLGPGEFVALIVQPPARLRSSALPVVTPEEEPDGAASCLSAILNLQSFPSLPMTSPSVVLGMVSAFTRDRHSPARHETVADHDSFLDLENELRKLIRELPEWKNRTSVVDHESGLVRAIAAMEREPGKSWTLSKLADEAEISRSSFAQKFKEQIGTTPNDHLLNLRMKLAEALMKDNRQQLKMIARMVGYRSVSAFSTAYKRWSGKSPSHDRRTPS